VQCFNTVLLHDSLRPLIVGLYGMTIVPTFALLHRERSIPRVNDNNNNYNNNIIGDWVSRLATATGNGSLPSKSKIFMSLEPQQTAKQFQ